MMSSGPRLLSEVRSHNARRGQMACTGIDAYFIESLSKLDDSSWFSWAFHLCLHAPSIQSFADYGCIIQTSSSDIEALSSIPSWSDHVTMHCWQAHALSIFVSFVRRSLTVEILTRPRAVCGTHGLKTALTIVTEYSEKLPGTVFLSWSNIW